MLIVGIIISARIITFCLGSKSGQFDDSNKIVKWFTIYDSVEDLNDAINKEKFERSKRKKLKVKRKRRR